jgi:hypothetical protein
MKHAGWRSGRDRRPLLGSVRGAPFLRIRGLLAKLSAHRTILSGDRGRCAQDIFRYAPSRRDKCLSYPDSVADQTSRRRFRRHRAAEREAGDLNSLQDPTKRHFDANPRGRAPVPSPRYVGRRWHVPNRRRQPRAPMQKSNHRQMRSAGPRDPAQRTRSPNRHRAVSGRNRALALRRRASAAIAAGLRALCDEPLEFAIDLRDSVRGAGLKNGARFASGNDGARSVIFASLSVRFELANIVHESLPLVDVEKYPNKIGPPSNPQTMEGP